MRNDANELFVFIGISKFSSLFAMKALLTDFGKSFYTCETKAQKEKNSEGFGHPTQTCPLVIAVRV